MGLSELTKNAVHVLPDGGLEAKLAAVKPNGHDRRPELRP